jgi:hypothetical protein
VARDTRGRRSAGRHALQPEDGSGRPFGLPPPGRAVATSFAVQVFATLPAQQTRSTAASGKWGLSQQVRNGAQALALPPKGGDSVKLTHRVSKCYLIAAIGHCVSACERTWRNATVKSAFRLWKRQRDIRATVRQRTARSRMLAAAQPIKNDGSHRRTNFAPPVLPLARSCLS